MALQVTNQRACQALRGQSVVVTLSGPESLSIIPQLELGMTCIVDANNNEGLIDWIDVYGLSFRVSPITLANDFSSGNGYLHATDTVTIEN